MFAVADSPRPNGRLCLLAVPPAVAWGAAREPADARRGGGGLVGDARAAGRLPADVVEPRRRVGGRRGPDGIAGAVLQRGDHGGVFSGVRDAVGRGDVAEPAWPRLPGELADGVTGCGAGQRRRDPVVDPAG